MNFVFTLASMCAEAVKNKVCLINSVEIKDVFVLETCLIVDGFISITSALCRCVVSFLPIYLLLLQNLKAARRCHTVPC